MPSLLVTHILFPLFECLEFFHSLPLYPPPECSGCFLFIFVCCRLHMSTNLSRALCSVLTIVINKQIILVNTCLQMMMMMMQFLNKQIYWPMLTLYMWIPRGWHGLDIVYSQPAIHCNKRHRIILTYIKLTPVFHLLI